MQYVDRGQLLGQNLLINGACQIAQRPTKAVAGIFDYGSVDRALWKAFGATISSGTMQQGTGLSYGATGTSAQLAGFTAASGSYVVYEQRVEASIAILAKNQVTSASALVQHDAGVTLYACINIYALAGTANDFNGAYNPLVTGAKIAVPTGTPTLITAANIPGIDTSKGMMFDVQFQGDAVSAGMPALTSKNFHVTNLQFNVGPKAAQFIALRFDEDLRACQRYYEKSYDYNVSPGTSTFNGCLKNAVNLTVNNGVPIGVGSAIFKVTKARTPSVVIYSPQSGAANKWTVDTTDFDGTAANIGTNSFTPVHNNATARTSTSNVHAVQWAADADY